MNCGETDDLLTLHLDVRLSEEARARLQTHLHRCPRCQDRVRSTQRLMELLRGEGPAEPSADLVARIMDGIDTEPVVAAAVEGWNRVALPFAFAAGIVALGIGLHTFFTAETVADPISAIVPHADTELGRVLATAKR